MKMAVTCTLLSLLAGPLLALPDPQPAPNTPEPGLEDLLAILQEETAVASKARMNADFVPGMVTVLHGSDMEALGVETVWEALSVVPGLQATRDRDGLPSVVVRGIDFPFNSGNIKILVNSVPLSRDNAGANSTVLLLPIQQVDRIEFIRGPGSVVHGEFAFMGLVNVVTRTQGVRAFARYGGNDAISAGTSLSFRPGTWELTVGAAGWRSEEPPLADPLVAHEGRGFGSLLARRGGFSLLAEAIARDLDPVGSVPTQTVDGAQEHWALDARYSRPWAAVRLDSHATLRNNDFRGGMGSFEGDVRELGLDVSGKTGRHDWVAGTLYQRSEIDTAVFRRPPFPGRPGGILTVTDEPRTVWSLLAEDRFDVTGALSLTAGLRFDDDSNVGSRLTPRAALVYRLTDRHIVKAQYAEGFRPPTFFELYGATGQAATDIDYEVNGTFELNYVYRHPRAVVRATAFHTSLRDMIFVTGPLMFDNVAEATTKGVELEWEQQVGSRLRFLANVTFLDEEETRNLPDYVTSTTPVAARFLANAAAFFRPAPRVLLAARLNHVGERSDDEETDGWSVLDLSLALEDVGARGLSLRGGVKNTFDDEIQYVVALPLTVQRNRFPGRTAWIQVAWDRP
jgi:outer membrane receptor for ferrienterochelin and colicins